MCVQDAIVALERRVHAVPAASAAARVQARRASAEVSDCMTNRLVFVGS